LLAAAFEMPGVGDVFALTGGQEGGHTHVNAGDRTRHGQRLRFDLDGDEHEPAGPPAHTFPLHGHLAQDRALWEIPVQADLNMADALDLESFRGG
jgi:hypothetical protein